MSSLRASSPTESSSLLEDAPSSYHSVNEVDESTTQNRQADGVTTVNQFSKTELYWILAGLWSGVLLGAFDGRTFFVQSYQYLIKNKEPLLRHFWHPSAVNSKHLTNPPT